MDAALVPILIVLLGGAGWWIRHEREHREEVEKQLSEHKYQTYIAFIDIFFDIINASRAGNANNVPNIDIIGRMTNANKELLIYGSDEVIMKYERWQKSAQGGQVSLILFAELIIAIRKDMGHQRTKLTHDNVLRSFIKDYDAEKERGVIR